MNNPKSKIKLSCVMLARNLLSQGYPFVEAILSVIQYCDEFIICEGYSDDGTYEVLKQLQLIYKDKIIIKRNKWESNKRIRAHVFSQVLNRAIRESSGTYILKLDPDHVFDKETIETVLFLANIYPNVRIFYLPYLYFIGNWIIKPELWAPTFFKNDGYIKIIKDSGGVTFTPLGFIKLALKNIRHPFDILKSVHYAYVPKPVYHYYALFPGNYITRIEEHKKFYNKHDWTPYDKVLKKLKTVRDWDIFWEIVAKEIVEKTWNWYGSRYGAKKVIKYKGDPPTPPLIKPLWRQWRYKIRDELINYRI